MGQGGPGRSYRVKFFAIVAVYITLKIWGGGIAVGSDLQKKYGIPPLTPENVKRWNSIHFKKVPRISADALAGLMRTGRKVLIIDAQSSDEIFRRGHICGAVRLKSRITRVDPKKVPKGILVASYCD